MKLKKQKIPKRIKLNNKVAANPLLGKSGRHEKTAKAKRMQEKVLLKKTWFERAAARSAFGSSHVVSHEHCLCL